LAEAIIWPIERATWSRAIRHVHKMTVQALEGSGNLQVYKSQFGNFEV